jgi:hypothetical protein
LRVHQEQQSPNPDEVRLQGSDQLPSHFKESEEVRSIELAIRENKKYSQLISTCRLEIYLLINSQLGRIEGNSVDTQTWALVQFPAVPGLHDLE